MPQVEKAAEEAEGYELDMFAMMYVSDGLGGSVDDVPWISTKQGQQLQQDDGAIFIDVREPSDVADGTIPGAWNVPMSAVMRHGLMRVLDPELITEILRIRKHQLIVVFSSVATPFSRCRAFCRWMLRAGSTSLKPARFRRLRGGLFGWRFRRGAIGGYDRGKSEGFGNMMETLKTQAILPPTDID